MALKPPSRRTEQNKRESRRAYDKRRGKTTERGYGWDWQQWRKNVLADDPLCHDCLAQGRVEPAVELHHKVKIKHDPTIKLDRENVLPLCRKCHAARTAKGE